MLIAAVDEKARMREMFYVVECVRWMKEGGKRRKAGESGCLSMIGAGLAVAPWLQGAKISQPTNLEHGRGTLVLLSLLLATLAVFY